MDKMCLFSWFSYFPWFKSLWVITHCLMYWQQANPLTLAQLSWFCLDHCWSGLTCFKILLISSNFTDTQFTHQVPTLTLHCQFPNQLRYLENKERCSIYTKPYKMIGGTLTVCLFGNNMMLGTKNTFHLQF